MEESLLAVADAQHFSVVEFTVAPNVNPPNGEVPYHEWFVEFDETPMNLDVIANLIDEQMCKQNIYYDDLRKGNVLQCLKIRSLQKSAFINYMKTKGKLGGQNKVPRLSNNRDIADSLAKYHT